MTSTRQTNQTSAAVKALPFTSPWLLAPMEGVTDPVFRDVVLGRHRPEVLGGAFTEFVRVTGNPVPRHVIDRHLSARVHPMPVGLQLMGNDLEALVETAGTAIEAGAPLIDVNFGCPARGAFSGCAGSALLADPPRIEGIIAALVGALPGEIVTAKIRAGVTDDALLEDIARAVECGGARLLTVHCRTRQEGYRDEAVDWRRIERVVAAVAMPICGNGGVARHAQLEQMRRETGCDYVMVGRGALADPWVFSGRQVDAGEAARFLLDYAAAIVETGGTPERAAGRVKQLLNYWTAGDLLGADRRSFLREKDPRRLMARIVEAGERNARADSAG